MGDKQESAGGYTITPEQSANLKRFAKKNGVPEQKIQTQLSQPKSVPSNKPPHVVQSKEQIAQQPKEPIVPQHREPVVTKQQAIVQNEVYQECETYFEHQNEEGGNLEIDLITFREKGVETRYLSLVFSGVDIRQDPPVPQEAYLNIGSKEAFDDLKAFFAQLNWEG